MDGTLPSEEPPITGSDCAGIWVRNRGTHHNRCESSLEWNRDVPWFWIRSGNYVDFSSRLRFSVLSCGHQISTGKGKKKWQHLVARKSLITANWQPQPRLRVSVLNIRQR